MVEVIYESDNFLVVNKPFDMYINSDDENVKNTVTNYIASHDSHRSTSANPLHFIHRLDYATSGVLCIAKKKRSATNAGKLFEKRLTKKYYLAVVRGHVGFELGDIEYPVGTDPMKADSSHTMMALTSTSTAPCVGPRPAHTRLLLLETGYYDNDPVSVVLLKPITGRRHQLRVHCAALGHTVLGDYTYSGTHDSAPHRMYLHAARLVLPLEQEPLDMNTPEPYFSDTRFTSKWRSERVFNKYKCKEEFLNACDTIDMSYVIGLKYKHFCNK